MSGILTQLQTLISSRFLGPSVLPMLVFWVLNGVMLFWLNASFRDFTRTTLKDSSTGMSALILGGVLVGVVLSGYVLSALLPAFQSFLEGRWPEWLARWFVEPHVDRRDAIKLRIIAVSRLRGALEPALENWKGRLTAARALGATTNVNTFSDDAMGARWIAHIDELRRQHRLVDAETLERTVAYLVADLQANHAGLPGPDGSYALDTAHQRLDALIDEAVHLARHEHIRLTNQLHFEFGTQRPAPTLMGNVANTVQSYAEERYNLNLEIFWSRLQRAVRRDKEGFAPVLTESKTQLDFLVACASLTMVWSLVWITVVLVIRAGRAPLLAAAAGPVLAYLWYRVTVAHYRTFADVLRTGVDLFRFELLKDLHLETPVDAEDERQLWDVLHRMTCYYEAVNLRFRHPQAS